MAEVIIPLDKPSAAEALAVVDRLGARADFYKVGLELYTRAGPDVVRELVGRGKRVFLDLKLHDIPNTVAGAVAGAEAAGVDYLTVHAGGGTAMLSAAAAAANRVRLLAVTLLTHLDAAALAELEMAGESRERARSWASLARRAGCAGAVCSPLEVADLRGVAPRPFVLVTPGIRFDQGRGSLSGDDQRRVANPAAAIAAGADLLVVGRPLTRAPDRGQALARLEEELAGIAGPAG